MALDNRKIRTFIVQQCCFLIFISSFASCIKFGLITPIEVVEEWGCQDSEIRLTCSSLDSTIAILEATFKPNCSLSSRNSFNVNANDSQYGNGTDAQIENCVQIDLKRLTPPKLPIYDETITGRRFLEALRQHHELDDNNTVRPNVHRNVKTASSFNFGMKPKADDADDLKLKQKRMNLRASLEELLVEYLNLRTASVTDDTSGDATNADDRSRVKRSSKSYPQSAAHARIPQKRNINDNNDHIKSEINNANHEEHRMRNSRQTVENPNGSTEMDNDDDDKSNMTAANVTKSVCPQRRQRISQLDRNELATAIQSGSEHEHNIRGLLNYRCSGKNHCRVVFNEHHPYSVLWPYGTIHIKYICMERYRLNKFCGEHLKVENESPEPEPEPELPLFRQQSISHKNDVRRDTNDMERNNNNVGPIAEALIQNEQMFHSLKILKASPSETEKERRKSAKPAEKDTDTASKRKGRIYSQDFRAMKVLPANLDDINDIEKVGNEFYFKKGDEIEFPNIDAKMVNRENSMKSTKAMFEPTEPSTSVYVSSYGKAIELDDNDDGTKNSIENGIDSSSSSDNNGLREARSTLGYDEVQNHKYHSISSRQPTPTAGTVSHSQRSTTVNLWNNELNTAVFETRPDDIDVGIDIFNLSENQTKVQLDAKIVRAKNDFTVIKTDRADTDREWEDDSDYDSYEDYEVKVNGPRVWRKNKVRTHESYQKTGMQFQPLQQGFIASPGYPSYYIGNSNCSWRITVNSGQPIRLVLLDVDLRYDPVCKDYLQIIDVGSKILLYQNCTEVEKPLEILSDSNEVHIALRTASTLAYPKRGILIYYAALGCIVPTAPKNGQLVLQTDDTLKFQCDPSYVFPDTISGSRTLYCTDRNTWDISLPDCVEQTSIKTKKDDPFVQHLWKQNQLGGNRTDQADMLFDVFIPLFIIIGLLVINGFIVMIIWRQRKKRKSQENPDQLAQL